MMKLTEREVFLGLGILGAVGLGVLLFRNASAAPTMPVKTGSGAPAPITINSGVSGSTVHVAVGQPLQFVLPLPNAGYSWADSYSGDSILGTPIDNSTSTQSIFANSTNAAGTETVTFTAIDSSGNADPNGTTYTFTITAA